MKTSLDCLLAAPDWAAEYSDALLNAKDSARLRQSPQLAQRLDWRVSRALKFQTASQRQSLSHSHGFAALLAHGGDFVVGVDLEKIKARDFPALSAWICSAEERHYLAERDWCATDYYRLWCVKEALIKAAGLDFPVDMARVGYALSSERIIGLRVDGQSGWHGVSALLKHTGQDFALACVWQGAADVLLRWHVYGGLAEGSVYAQQAV